MSVSLIPQVVYEWRSQCASAPYDIFYVSGLLFLLLILVVWLAKPEKAGAAGGAAAHGAH
jgi:hypothetical protein